MPSTPTTPPQSTTCQGGSILDTDAERILEIWEALPEAGILLRPSQADGATVITHSMGGPPLKINGLLSKSPLSNYALYSFECVKRFDLKANDTSPSQLLNLYEVMMPDIPGENGEESTAEFYVRRLWELDLHVAGVHFHWWGSTVFSNDRLVAAIHHQSSKLSVEEFSRRTIQALQEAMELVERKGILYPTDQMTGGNQYETPQQPDSPPSMETGTYNP